MSDIIEQLYHSTIQHGPYNKRIYVLKLHNRDIPDIIVPMDRLGKMRGYEKILVKVPARFRQPFKKAGYDQEAAIPGFSKGKEDVLFMAKYLSSERRKVIDQERIHEILDQSKNRNEESLPVETELESYKIRRCSHLDIEEMSRVYKEVFKTYPFPIYDPEYLFKMMRRHVQYYCVLDNARIISLAGSEIDERNLNVEMTDFATMPAWRGKGLAFCLLKKMGKEMVGLGIRTAFTIARSLSPAMNITFGKMNYHFAGTLWNNTNISGKIQSMNVWYKKL